MMVLSWPRYSLNAMAVNAAIAVCFQVEDSDVRLIPYDEPSADIPNELLMCLGKSFREAVNSEVEGSEALDMGLISEYAEVGLWPETGDAVDESDVVGLEENEISANLEGKGHCSH